MEQYNVTGMSCAACSARVEKAVAKLDGVTSCSVSLLTNSMGVEGTASPEEIMKAVEEAGYGASKKGAESATAGKTTSSMAEQEDSLKDRETPVLRSRLLYSLGFLLVLMYFSMGHMMFGWPIPAWFEQNHVAVGILELLLSAIIMVINQKFFISGFKSLIHGAPNMDTLVAMGSAASFAWSVYALFGMTGAVVAGNHDKVMEYMNEFYFESAAMILTLITVGKMLEAFSKGKTTNALKGLMQLAPKTATILQGQEEVETPIEQVKAGDIFLVRPGENIPVDGIVVEGTSAVNEAAITGESIPVDKEAGSSVTAGTVNQSGFLKCEATRVGEDTTLSQIIRMVSDAAATKAPIAKIADKVSGIFVPVVISIAVVTTIIWLLAGETFAFALARGIAVLVISCPCALGLATPVAIMVGNGVGAKNGILFKTAVSLEETGKTNIVVFDKTGTITSGTPTVTDVVTVEEGREADFFRLAYSLEQRSEHPLAKAVVEYVKFQSNTAMDAAEISNFRALPGNGLQGYVDGKEIQGGSLNYIQSIAKVPERLESLAASFAEEGKTPILFTESKEVIGMFAVADVIKADSPEAIKELKNMGIRVVMLTGDNKRTAEAIGRQAGVDEVIADVLPQDKERVIRELKERGKVIMVGDGINDAPALTVADIGVAIGAGTDVAIDAADVVLVNSKLSDVPAAIRLSRGTLRNIHQNLFWAFFYNIIGIPLAAGLYYPIWGWKLSPMFGAAAMSLSSFCVVTNALRLNFLKIRDASKDVKRAQKSVEKERSHTMTKTVKIEGMMCEHCEMRVKKALEALDAVENATVSHKEGTAVVTLKGEVSDDALTQAVVAQDYKVTGITE